MNSANRRGHTWSPRRPFAVVLALFWASIMGGCEGSEHVESVAAFGFSADYPEFYGVLYLVNGEQDPLELGTAGVDLPTCAEPVEPKEGTSLVVTSSNGYRWIVEPESSATPCTHVRLGIEENVSGLYLITIHTPEVLPARIELDGDPVGFVERTGPYSPERLDKIIVEADDAERRRIIAEYVSDGGGFLLARPPGKHTITVVLANGDREEKALRFRDGMIVISSYEYFLMSQREVER